MKIAILGFSGSGKSTLAKRLGALFCIPVLYLDTVQFEANWVLRDRDEARRIVSDFMKQEKWVIDGNYRSFLQKERLDQADHILFLNFSRLNCVWRAYKRYLLYKNTSRESMAEECDEKFDLEFLWWILYQGKTPEIIRHYRDIVYTYRDKTIVIKNQRQLDAFLRNPFGMDSHSNWRKYFS